MSIARLCALLAALSVGVPARAAAPEQVDLSSQFPDAACRSQGWVGSCHSFASIALLEAALFRGRGPFPFDTVRPRLSEADLFVGKKVADPSYFAGVRSRLTKLQDGQTVAPVKEDEIFEEGGDLKPDLDYAIANGVAEGKFAPWDAFEKKYKEYKKARAQTAAGRLEDCQKKAAMAQGVSSALESLSASFTSDAKRGYSDTFADLRTAQIDKVRADACVFKADADASIASFLADAAAYGAAARKHLLGTSFEMSMSRLRIKDRLKGYTAPDEKFAFPMEYWGGGRNDAAWCLEHGAKAGAAIVAYLRRGMPVGVGMDVGGLKAWTAAPFSVAGHAIVLTGFQTGADGKTVFQTRNSWGGMNPDLAQDELCRVDSVVAVKTAAEE